MCDSANIGTVSEKVFWKNQDLANILDEARIL
jgi:hypothetical protein